MRQICPHFKMSTVQRNLLSDVVSERDSLRSCDGLSYDMCTASTTTRYIGQFIWAAISTSQLVFYSSGPVEDS